MARAGSREIERKLCVTDRLEEGSMAFVHGATASTRQSHMLTVRHVSRHIKIIYHVSRITAQLKPERP